MDDSSVNQQRFAFRPLVVGAHYAGIERGLAADVLAARTLGGAPLTVCTSLVSAGRGRVTDVLEVPSDSVSAQLEHVLETSAPTAARLGILGSHQTVAVVFDALRTNLDGPILLDVTLSGPSGEDVVGPRGLDALQAGFADADLVTLRRLDAERVASQQITKLSEAQVAVQRIARQGAQRVLLRCGDLVDRADATSNGSSDENMNVDLYYDGDEFALFEAPHLPAQGVHGSSSAYAMAALHHRPKNTPWPASLQHAKAFTTEMLRSSLTRQEDLLDHFWRFRTDDVAAQ